MLAMTMLILVADMPCEGHAVQSTQVAATSRRVSNLRQIVTDRPDLHKALRMPTRNRQMTRILSEQ